MEDRIYLYLIDRMLYCDNSEIQDILHKRLLYKKRRLNIFILFVFIVAIGVYSIFSLVLMAFALLLFFYWIIQIEYLSKRRQYNDSNVRHILYRNEIQGLIEKGKFKQAMSLFSRYTMKHENEDIMKLYLIVLFLNEKYEDFIIEFDKSEMDNDYFLDFYKYSLFILKKENLLLSIIDINKPTDNYYYCVFKNLEIDNSEFKI